MPLTQIQSGMIESVAQYYGFKNRIINGDMRIDQRNAGASVTQNTSGIYTVDRFAAYGTVTSKFTVQRSTTAPVGFTNSVLITSSSAYSVTSSDQFVYFQAIEGLNVADLGWGTANAQTITVSFWVRSSLTGTFGGSIRNSAVNRSYPFRYTISAANTWEQKNVTITGDTSGTWLTDNGIGMYLTFSMGSGSTLSGTAGAWAGSNLVSVTGATSVVGTNGATFYITGVQLEKGSTATSFDYRPYGTELMLCQRYYEKSYSIATTPGTVATAGYLWNYINLSSGGATDVGATAHFKVSKRAAATMTYYSPDTGASGKVSMCDSFGNASDANSQSAGVNENMAMVYGSRTSSTNAQIRAHWVASAEL